jgi:hypothetical protein
MRHLHACQLLVPECNRCTALSTQPQSLDACEVATTVIVHVIEFTAAFCIPTVPVSLRNVYSSVDIDLNVSDAAIANTWHFECCMQRAYGH